MARKTGIGHQNFEKIRVRDIFYVDKTDFIREWWEAEDEVTMVTRPRRFGKTLNMSMLEAFFSVEYAGRAELFEGLSIWKNEKYRALQGTYPVIALSFADIKDQEYETAREKICQILSNLYSKNEFLLESGCLNEKEKKFFENVTAEMNDATATMAIHQLSLYLSRYYEKNVIILLDEYDTPMQEAYVNGYWERLLSFMRSMFNSAFKTNPYLERALMTGITRVSKESIFSDLNNPEVVTATSNKYEEVFGFTEREVFAALEEFGLSNKKQEVRAWYDGFTFGKRKDIYNPWSIINYLDKKELGIYWANTSSNSLIGKLIKEGKPEVKRTFETLMQGGTIEVEIDEQIVYSQLTVKETAIWSLMLAGGYLKVVETKFIEKTGRACYELSLTNKEVQVMFEDMVRDWFHESDYYNEFIRALLLGDLKAMNVYMNKVSSEVFSYFDTGKKPSEAEPERFYHGFVLGLIAELSDKYTITSNRESGFGRYDVMLEPRKEGDDGIILEFKVQDADDEQEKELAGTVEAALKQIEEKAYETALMAKGVPKERIRKYGFAFCGKKVLIGSRK